MRPPSIFRACRGLIYQRFPLTDTHWLYMLFWCTSPWKTQQIISEEIFNKQSQTTHKQQKCPCWLYPPHPPHIMCEAGSSFPDRTELSVVVAASGKSFLLMFPAACFSCSRHWKCLTFIFIKDGFPSFIKDKFNKLIYASSVLCKQKPKICQ